MAQSYVGFAVSINCGDVLGTYQGFVSDVDEISQTISLKKAYRNGVHCQVPQITLDARDIKLLKFIDLLPPAETFNKIPYYHSAMKLKDICENNITSNGSTSVFNKKYELPNYKSDTNTSYRNDVFESHEIRKLDIPHDKMEQEIASQKKNEQKQYRRSPNQISSLKFQSNQKSVSERKKFNSDPINGDVSLNPFNFTDNNKENFTRSRANSASECNKRSKRFERSRKHSLNDDSMEDITNYYSDDFDFEKNLALFDKQAVFEEIEKNSNQSNSKFNGYMQSQNNYKCYENVIPSKPTEYRQIIAPGSSLEYVTDSGLIVPCINEEERKKLRSISKRLGFHLIETVGRSLAEMVMQLSGGPCRLTPKNSHQHPSVVVICGAHEEGAMSINCARQLAVRNVLVTIFMQPKAMQIKEVNDELCLFKLTKGKIVTKTTDLPNGPVDMIISSLENDDNINTVMTKQDWYEEIITWIKLNKAPVIALEPPANGTIMDIKWAMVLGLPPQMALSYSQLYLCDLGLSPAVFNEISITYNSPFGHKYVVALHRKGNT